MTLLSYNATQTAAALSYPLLVRSIQTLLRDTSVQVPTRTVVQLDGGGYFFAMPATDRAVGMTKLITLIPNNANRGLPAIQGDIVTFDARNGQRLAILDGPTITARRTAAVSVLAAQLLAPNYRDPLLIVGAGVQGRAHLEAFHEVFGVTEMGISSRSETSARALVAHAISLGIKARFIADPNCAIQDFGQIISCTPANEIALTVSPNSGSFISAVGAFTPRMAEWSASVCQSISRTGVLAVDTRDADHEAGDFLQAGISVATLPCLADIVNDEKHPARNNPSTTTARTVFFKNCGWAGWDLAAAKAALNLIA